MTIRCGHCKNTHETIAQVRRCATAEHRTPQAAERPLLPMGPTLLDHMRAEGPARDALNSPTARRRYVPEVPAARTPQQAEPKERKRAELPEVAPGHYVVSVDGGPWVVKVDRPTEGKWAGWTFVERESGGNYLSVRNFKIVRAIVQQIADDPTGCAAAYGHATGRCGICHRKLTVKESVQRGIGPKCARDLSRAG